MFGSTLEYHFKSILNCTCICGPPFHTHTHHTSMAAHTPFIEQPTDTITHKTHFVTFSTYKVHMPLHMYLIITHLFVHRSNLYRGVSCPLPDISSLNIQEAYRGLSQKETPMITTMAISSDVPLVESMFGLVQEASVLSYQLPVRTVPSTRPHTDAPSPPQLPLSGYRLGPSACAFVCSEHQHHHLSSLATLLETAHKI